MECNSPSSVLSSGDGTMVSQKSTNTKEVFNTPSPHYMKTTSCCDAKKENFQKFGRAMKIAFWSGQGPTRSDSQKFKRSAPKMKKSRSIKKTAKQSSIYHPTQPHYAMATSSSDARSIHLELSPCDSYLESTPCDSLSSSGSNEVNSMMSSLRCVKKLQKRGVRRPTYSSALKSPEDGYGGESKETSTDKSCPYSYCSLHGHRRSDVPPLKSFISMRRRALENQKSMKQESPGGEEEQKPCESNIAELLKEAFNKLLGEIPEQSSDHQSTNSDTISNHRFANAFEGQSPESTESIKSTAKNPTKWSNMEKILTLNKFFKELEKARQIEPLGPDSEAEKTSLGLDEKGNNIDAHTHDQTEVGQSEAISLLEEAIDQISVLDIKEDSADETNSTMSLREPVTGPEIDGKPGSESDEKMNKNWNKAMLVREFTKAIKAAKKRSLQENVNLKHQETGDRKRSDEWMIDYVLQQVIAKLIPNQKRKVELLVEAFETLGRS